MNAQLYSENLLRETTWEELNELHDCDEVEMCTASLKMVHSRNVVSEIAGIEPATSRVRCAYNSAIPPQPAAAYSKDCIFVSKIQ